MQVFDLYHDCFLASGLDFQTISTDTDTDGNIIDTAHFEALTFMFLSGTVTDGDYTVELWHGEESDLSDATEVDSEEVLGSVDFAAADDDTPKRIGYIGKERYVRVRVVSTSTSTGAELSAIACLSTPHSRPVDNQ
ncbi:MAG: hypothetical protein GY820_17240 [Gammaproteobacteria bacterium]|nr:hypothetical protein [Gammaproteobacteria bacterium]